MITQAKEQGIFAEMFNTEDINVAGDIFTNGMNKILDKHAPIKVIQNRTNYVPYLTEEIKDLMEERNHLKCEAAESGDLNCYNEYKTMRNLVTTKLKSAKTDYYKSKFQDNDMSSRDMWSSVNTVLGNVKSQFPPQIMIDGILLSKPMEMATAVNKYFIKKIADLKTNIDIIVEHAVRQLNTYVNQNNLPAEGLTSVSYTQLTLPTNREV